MTLLAASSDTVLTGGRYARASAVALALLVAAAFLFCFAGVLEAVVHQWWSSDAYSYGVLVPVISLYMLWLSRARLAGAAPHPSWPLGLGLLAAGLLLHVTGDVGALLVAQEIAVVVCLVGAVALALGRSVLRVMWPPLVYLLLMFPFWGLLTEPLHYPFQLFSASLGTALLEFAGIPAYRDANYIELPNAVLDVARACSGVNYLISIVAIGIPLAYLFLSGVSRRVLLVGLAVVVAVASNGLRVAIIGWLANSRLTSDPHGPFHALQGMSVAAVGYATLLVVLGILLRTEPHARAASRVSEAPGWRTRWHAAPRLVAPLAVTLLLLFGAGSYVRLRTAFEVPPRTDLRAVPVVIGTWAADGTRPPFVAAELLDPDVLVSRRYREAGGRVVELHLAYFASQGQGHEAATSAADAVLGGAVAKELTLAPGVTLSVNERRLPASEGGGLLLYWYDVGGRATGSRTAAKLYTLRDGLFRGRTNAALVALLVSGRTEERTAVLREAAVSLMRGLWPALDGHLT